MRRRNRRYTFSQLIRDMSRHMVFGAALGLTGFGALAANLVGGLIIGNLLAPKTPSAPSQQFLPSLPGGGGGQPEAVEPKDTSTDEALAQERDRSTTLRRQKSLTSSRGFSTILQSAENDTVTTKSLLGR